MTEPIQVKEIWEFIPHRPPMVWVDEVLTFNASGGATQTHLKPDAHYLDTAGRLRASSCLEFMAQSYGFVSLLHKNNSGNVVKETPKRAFLAAFNDAEFADLAVFDAIKAGATLRTEISGARAMGPIILFSGKVQLADQVLATARMKIFSE